ncbi:MAG: ATP-binding cassette domain-containing protein, partial [Candidatus Methylopumilus sp.]
MILATINKRLHGTDGEFRLDATLEVAEGEFVALFGPSGVGKTTLLRCLAGLDLPEQGNIVINGETWLDTTARINLPPQQRHVGYMFQDYALFPNMTVRGNLEFALRKGSDKKRIDELLALMDLGELQQRKPETLSGGQKQRVALARSLASEPRLLLLDEPFSALDATMRVRLHDEILRLQRHFGITTIIVSHDVGEVYKLASRVLIMESGRIVQQGSPHDVFSAGQTSGKFRFTGEV